MERILFNLMPLNGTNYTIWKVQCKMTLHRNDLWNIVNEREIVPEPRRGVILQTIHLSRTDCSLATFVLPVELPLIYLIGYPDDPALMWKKTGRPIS